MLGERGAAFLGFGTAIHAAPDPERAVQFDHVS
jgi:hypothetical protein